MKRILLPILTYLLLSHLAFGQTFDIYVCDGGNFNNPPWQILKFDENGEVFINQELSWPQDILFLEDQEAVLISNLNTGRITRYNSDSGEYIDNFATGINGPTRMKIGRDSLLYVLQWGNSEEVLRFELDGTPVGDFTNTGVTNSIGLDWDHEGNLYVSSYGGNFIRKYDANGIDQGNFITGGVQGPTNIWFDLEGDLLVNNWNGSTVSRYSPTGEFKESFMMGLSNPEGIAIYPNGDHLIGDGGSSAVKRFDSEGNFVEDIVAAGSLNLILPNAVVLREKETVSVSEEVAATKFIESNLGSEFRISKDFHGKIDRIEIYDMSGELVVNRIGSDPLVWSAQTHPPGFYIIKGFKGKETIGVQKIVVKY